MFSTSLLPDPRSRPIFSYMSPEDWAVLCAPFLILIAATRLAMKQYHDPISQTIRYLLLPIGAYAFAYACAFRDYSGGISEFNPWNYGVGLFAFAASMKLVEVTFMQNSPKCLVDVPVGETAPPNGHATNGHATNGHATNGSAITAEGKKTSTVGLKAVPTTGSIGEVLAYLGDPRGIRYDVGGKAVKGDARRKVVERRPFLLTMSRGAIFHICLHDLCQTIFQSIPGTTVGTPQGGSIYIESIPVPQRYIVSTAITLVMGIGVYAGLEAGFDLIALFGVGVCGVDPADYPPIFDKPWISTSVRELWSKRWHSVFRNYFSAIGWVAGHALLGTIGGVLGVFTLSGLLHDWTIWGMGQGTDAWRIVGFFYLQGVAVILEDVWRRMTGRKVQGWWGRLWTITFMLSTAHLIVEAWLQRGIGGGIYFIPGDRYRPSLRLRNCLMNTI